MKPNRIALIIASVYLVPSLIYIFVSSRLVSDATATAEEAMVMEIIKGSIYVFLSALLVFAISWKATSLIRKRREEAQSLRESLLEAERRGAASLFAASIAHDARNELAVLKSNNSVLQRRADLDEFTREVLVEQQEAVDRLVKMTDHLVDAGRSRLVVEPQMADLVALSKRILKTLNTHSRLNHVKSVLIADESVSLHTSPVLVYQVLVNLVLNAGDAVKTSSPGRIEVRITKDDDRSIIEVHDNGPGIAKDIRDHVFDAFYTTKNEGTGLGLLSVKACVDAHAGLIEIDDSPLGGACFRIILRDIEGHPVDQTTKPRVVTDAGQKDSQEVCVN